MQLTCLHLSLAALFLASCNTLPHQDESPARAQDPGASSLEKEERSRKTFRVEGFHRNVEIEEVEFDDPGFAETTLTDERRVRTGVQVSYGHESLRGFVEVFHEDFLGSGDGYGFTFGVKGQPRLHALDNGAMLILPYSAGGTLASGGDIEVEGSKGDLGYAEAALDAGIGIDYRGLQSSVGFSSKALVGYVDSDADPDSDNEDLDASFASGYVELAYRPSGTAFEARLRGLAGQEQGAYISLSYGF